MKKETIKVAIELNAKIEKQQGHLERIKTKTPLVCVFWGDYNREIPLSGDLRSVIKTLAIAEIEKDIANLSAELESL